MDQFRAKFIEEATDLLSDLEKNLLALSDNRHDQTLIEEVFRAMHTLKGSSAMFGFASISSLTHHLESIYEAAREGQLLISDPLLNISLASLDHLRNLLTDAENPATLQKHKDLMEEVIQLVASPYELSPAAETTVVSRSELQTYYLLFRPHAGIMTNGTNPLYLIDDLYVLGSCRVIAHPEVIPELPALDAVLCYTYWEVFLVTSEPVDAIRDVFIFVGEESVIDIEPLWQGNLLEDALFTDWLALQQGEIGFKKAKERIALMQPTAVTPLPTGVAEITDKIGSGKQKEAVISSIRVPSAKLDHLMNLVSELVTTQARLSLLAEKSLQGELISVAEEVEKLSRQLRDSTFDLCLVPIDTLFVRFQRLVRDLSAELDKEIVLVQEGGETELDKNIIENLVDPLLHILRNSADHGIEAPAVRRALGKPVQGRISIRAYYSGAHVVIEVQDDGRGVHREKIREKAIERKLISPDAVLSDKEITQLIFRPGFSTAERLTGVSGRGVGMDVVRQRISDLRGEIEVSSTPGEGTTIQLRLPLTLSIIDGLLVTIDENYFVVPLSVVDKCYEVPHAHIARLYNNQVVLNGELIPFFYLRKELDITENCPAIEQAIVIEYDHQRIALIVDMVIGKYQAVLKPLGKFYKHLQIISGATILGDGNIALVVDTNKMVQHFSMQQQYQDFKLISTAPGS